MVLTMNEELKKLSKYLSIANFKNININSGGCGRAALEFYKYLRRNSRYKLMGFKVLTSYPESNVNKNYLNSFEHIILVFKDLDSNLTYYIDAVEGVKLFSKLNYRYMKGYLSYKQLKTNVLYNNWNTTFNVYDIKHLRSFLRTI